jgi:hypothetical protein
MDMDDQIVDCHRRGLTREETFQLMCSERNLPSIPADLMIYWFKTLDETPVHAINSDLNYCELILKIRNLFDKIQNTICDWSNVVFSDNAFLNGRFSLALQYVGDQSILYFLDSFHGQVK